MPMAAASRPSWRSVRQGRVVARLSCTLMLMPVASAVVSAQHSTAMKPLSETVFQIEREGLTLELAPLPREAVRAFMIGRGLSQEDAALAAERGCIFRSAIGNAATSPEGPALRVALSDWRVHPDGGASRGLALRQHWDAFWRARKLAEASAVAFHWALFPSEQVFAPTDHNWGFLSFELPPGTRFSLDVSWTTGASTYTDRLDGLTCAP